MFFNVRNHSENISFIIFRKKLEYNVMKKTYLALYVFSNLPVLKCFTPDSRLNGM
jgi:hypothetical protein